MENKQVFIDCVDVSECEFLNKTKHCKAHMSIMGTDTNKCKCFPNCYFKQLQREKQNSQEARDTAIKEFNRAEELKTLLKNKAQECEELEKKIENYCFDCDVAERMRKVTYAATGGRLSYANYTVEAIEQARDDQLRIDVEYRTKELEEQLNQLKAQLLDQEAETLKAGGIIYALKQTLTEIKPILGFYANPQMGEEQSDKTYHIRLNGGYIMVYDSKPARQALQKIRECEAEK